METYPNPKNDVTAEEILIKLIEQAPVYFFQDKKQVLYWAQRELDAIQNDEQLKLFDREET